MKNDSVIVEEVRRRRHELSERYGHDVHAYGQHLKEIEKEYRSRLVSQITVVRAKDAENLP